jgi:hypothetical protein
MFIKSLIIIISMVIALGAIMALAGCSSGDTAETGSYPDVLITPTVNSDTVSIPVSFIESNHNVHFELPATQGNSSFVAYLFKGQIQVRASYCVPCRGTSFTLNDDKLICNNCGTVFSAKDGTGISGVAACQSYPKAAVSFTKTSGNIVMRSSDLQTAFSNTILRGLP